VTPPPGGPGAGGLEPPELPAGGRGGVGGPGGSGVRPRAGAGSAGVGEQHVVRHGLGGWGVA